MKQNKLRTRDPIKDYFPLPNEIFDLDLSYGEIAVYAYLLCRENRQSFQCHPSYKTIGKALKMSRNTVSKYIKKLEEKEFITTEPTNVQTAAGEKRNGNLLYTILPIEQAKRKYYARQFALNQQKLYDENLKIKLDKSLIKLTDKAG